LPREPSVTTLLDEYLTKLQCPTISAASLWTEGNPRSVCVGALNNIFSSALPQLLCAGAEQTQHEQIFGRYKTRKHSDTYGVEHFMRFAVRLPVLMSVMTLEDHTVTELVKEMLNILEYIDARRAELFLTSYDSLGARKR